MYFWCIKKWLCSNIKLPIYFASNTFSECEQSNTYYKAWDFCKLFCNYSFSTIYLRYNFNLMIRVPSFSLSLALSRIRTSNCVTSNINKEKLPLSHKWKGLNYKSFVFWNKSRQFWNVFGQFWNIFRQLWNIFRQF